ncbi:MAG: site-specific DNA-methyltransferase [Mariniphaga sp.]|nr:site-specific DNA-methyltransferase [Mariniphaga sp.]
MAEQDFIKAGFTVVGTENNENKLLSFLKENYPNVIRDTEINLEELKTVLGLPIDEKVNGYGLNFVGRNFARAKYAQKTEKELRLNNTLSKNIDISTSLNAGTENLVLKGDNLDSLKILKNHYSGKIKCIYIDPPYNTAGDEFVYPDKFDKEEAEVLGLANLSESDFARMDFSFKTKKSHNGWLAFMYPRLLLARDLLNKDGVIFISIDDNEQANLKLLCDDVFGEENFVAQITRATGTPTGGGGAKPIVNEMDYLLVYSKSANLKFSGTPMTEEESAIYDKEDENGIYLIRPLRRTGGEDRREDRPTMFYPLIAPDGTEVYPIAPAGYESRWICGKEKFDELNNSNLIEWKKNGNNEWNVYQKFYLEGRLKQPGNLWVKVEGNKKATRDVRDLFDGIKVFEFPKPIGFISKILQIATDKNDIVLDFFAGSGTTGHAVMQLNAEDGGNRKFILCQIDEPIKEDKPAYKFCVQNNLPPVISSITIERLKRAGEKMAKEETEKKKKKEGELNFDMVAESKAVYNSKKGLDLGFKVFDSIVAPQLKVDETGQISITENDVDALSRIYNMIFTVGLDEPSQVPEEVVKDCIYKIGNNYYITNSEKITSDDYANAIKNGKVFIDGWTASLNGTLQNYKEDVKIVF